MAAKNGNGNGDGARKQVSTQTERQPGAEREERRRSYRPPTDIYEHEDAYEVVVDMPGVDPGSVDITVERQVLTITGKSSVRLPEGFRRIYGEYEPGDFERSFTLGQGIEQDGMQATMKNGVLSLRLRKAREMQPQRIKVKAS